MEQSYQPRTVEELAEDRYGPVIAWFTIGAKGATTGVQPPGIEAAWAGVALPIRERLESSYGEPLVSVDIPEAHNALVAAGASEAVLQYWVDMFNSPEGQHLGDLFYFRSSDGVIDYSEK